MNNVVEVKIPINNNKIEVGYNLTKPNFYISFDHPLIGDTIDYLAKLECMPIEVDSFDKAVFINFKCKNCSKNCNKYECVFKTFTVALIYSSLILNNYK